MDSGEAEAKEPIYALYHAHDNSLPSRLSLADWKQQYSPCFIETTFGPHAVPTLTHYVFKEMTVELVAPEY